ncbi:MAG TPA: NADH-quinone oxidoreductase subunit A [Candidatus Hydrogenedentes bacterium]|nr:NADH-quinone oxidoreductase subunit A [Candidatus Hydrogenedentota bacterium]
MVETAAQAPALWPFVVYFLGALSVPIGMIVVSFLIGERHKDRATGEPYESGIVSTGSARVRFSAKYFMIAIFFVVFDLESVFIYIWATSVRELGWLGYAEVCVFIGVLLAALVYLWRDRALES